jgi:hypothetical protein
MTRPVGCGGIGSAVFVDLGPRISLGNRSYRSLRDGSLVARIPQAMNCLAAIIQSLRDAPNAELCVVVRSVIYSNILARQLASFFQHRQEARYETSESSSIRCFALLAPGF